jgi:hypothetical protein
MALEAQAQQWRIVREAQAMANKDQQGRLGATDSGPRPGAFPFGSAQSRAAARSLLATRRAKEEEQGFQVVTKSILDGKPVNLDGLAERIRAARLKGEAGGLPGSSEAEDGGMDHSEGTWGDCLSERIRMARERVARMQDQDSIL